MRKRIGFNNPTFIELIVTTLVSKERELLEATFSDFEPFITPSDSKKGLPMLAGLRLFFLLILKR